MDKIITKPARVREAFEKRPRVPVVYIDSNIFKFAATAVLRLFPWKQLIQWEDGATAEHVYYEPRYINRNERIKKPKLLSEVDLIEPIAAYIKIKRVVAVTHLETHLGSWGLPNMDSVTGKFYGARVSPIKSPVRSSRLLFYGGRDPINLQRRFLRGIKHPRFLELQKVTGGYQGEGRYSWNQMLDAFALWCAEHNKCDYFLTLDMKLINLANIAKKRLTVKLVTPSQLLEVLDRSLDVAARTN